MERRRCDIDIKSAVFHQVDLVVDKAPEVLGIANGCPVEITLDAYDEVSELVLIANLSATENGADKIFSVGSMLFKPLINKSENENIAEIRKQVVTSSQLLAEIDVAKQMAVGVPAAPREFVLGKDSTDVCADVKAGPVKRGLDRLDDGILVHSGVDVERKKCGRAKSEGPF